MEQTEKFVWKGKQPFDATTATWEDLVRTAAYINFITKQENNFWIEVVGNKVFLYWGD